jgi:hypothetical protein
MGFAKISFCQTWLLLAGFERFGGEKLMVVPCALGTAPSNQQPACTKNLECGAQAMIS